jgi:Holliday junction DNA helicase RuvA
MPSHNTANEEALSALMMLGFSKSVAEKTLDSIIKSGNGDLTVEQLIKTALKSL